MIESLFLSGSANRELAAAVARESGAELQEVVCERFPDGEVHVELRASVRRRDVIVIQPTSPPVDRHLIELLALADACRRSGAEKIIAVVPYFGYARSDRREARRAPIMASMVSRLIEAAGIAHLVTVDLHAPQIEGFFTIPVDNLTAVCLLADDIAARLPQESVVVSPDAGRVPSASVVAGRLQRPLVVLHKRRESGTETAVTHIVGDVRGKSCLIIDDMISTAGTISEAAEALVDAGASTPILVAATHGLFLDGAGERLRDGAIGEVLVTDSIDRDADIPSLRRVSIARFLADALGRIADHM